MPRQRPVGTKHCPHCKGIKVVDEFYSSEKYDGGYSPWCKVCSRQSNNDRWKNNRDKMLIQSRSYYQKHKDERAQDNRDRARANNMKMKLKDPAKFRAKKFFDSIKARVEVASDVNHEYLTDLFRKVTHCQCCGILLELTYEDIDTRRASGHLWNPRSPSIDRVNNNKGYTRNNIAVICWNCNHRKTDLTLDDLAMFHRYIVEFGDV